MNQIIFVKIIEKFVNMCREVTKILECMNYYLFHLYIMLY